MMCSPHRIVLGLGFSMLALSACSKKNPAPQSTDKKSQEAALADAKQKAKEAAKTSDKKAKKLDREKFKRIAPDKRRKLYAQTIELLKNSDDVIPPRLKIHPVTATFNREAIIPPQCYTRTEGHFNPCYVCHQDPIPGRENTMSDADLQAAYTFSDVGFHNHWDNLFEDRSAKVAKISDKEILKWINQDNYTALAPRLKEAGFKGWIPDLKDLQKGALAFGADGFAKDGSDWVAFNYKPLPSTFWPTNGSTDDVMIRLAPKFRKDESGKPSKDVYRANLAITEAIIKGLKEITVAPLDENKVNKDLNGDGKLGMIRKITKVNQFVGQAKTALSFPGVYPLNTEFLHSVRYLGIDKKGQIGVSTRMKELRYMRKLNLLPKFALDEKYREEDYAKEAGQLPGYIDEGSHGLNNGMGWVVTGFIEAPSGKLRFNTYEENLSCMGCHNSIGATIDKTFSFARKPDGAKGWGYINLHGMQDVPNRGEKDGEFLTYFTRVGGGGEFRSNPEMQKRFFLSNGKVNRKAILAEPDIYSMIVPSKERALMLNKAYRTIVADQDYIYGKDATVTAPKNVYRDLDPKTAPTLPPKRRFKWDIRLNWNQKAR